MLKALYEALAHYLIDKDGGGLQDTTGGADDGAGEESEEEDYCSDFSDEDFGQETALEQRATQTVYQVQGWLSTSSSRDSPDILGLFQAFDLKGKGLVHYEDMAHCLERVMSVRDLKSRAELREMIEVFSEGDSQLGQIDYRAFVRDLRGRAHPWWQERIRNNCFELRNLLNKEGTFTKRLSLKLAKFQLGLISMRLKLSKKVVVSMCRELKGMT
jgi:hypothetical protein